ncbi:flavin reductase family protein [Kitasatospora sp. NPDC048540]|uniref:flavin reductase family protein n=1 Tax=unclassified Kitasatospora TaxID=2633591 RepID=UPI0006EB332C|nr:flavin reductase family protein [Kitasatospora sp. MBT63]
MTDFMTSAPPSSAAHLETVPAPVFREAMTRFAAGVTVVTAYAGGDPVGCTATAVLSLTDRPPTLLVSLASGSGTLECIRTAGHFGVSVLPYALRGLADRFAGQPAARRFTGVAHERRSGAPLLTGSVAGLVCRVSRYVSLDDHTLVVGRVVHTQTDDGDAPLVHFARRQTRPCQV